MPNQCSRAFIVWLTGLSGTGKTTLASALRDRLAMSRVVEILDGDEMRATICKDLGYSKEDRHTNIYRIGCIAQQLALDGVAAIVAAISPYREGRDEARRKASAEGVPFVEIFLDVPLEVLVGRDVKGLYRRALSGELAHFTGISDPYEPPERPDLRIRTDLETIEASVERVVVVLQERGLLGPDRGVADYLIPATASSRPANTGTAHDAVSFVAAADQSMGTEGDGSLRAPWLLAVSTLLIGKGVKPLN